LRGGFVSVGSTFRGSDRSNIEIITTRGGATKSKPSSRSDTSSQAFATHTAGIDASILEAEQEVCFKTIKHVCLEVLSNHLSRVRFDCNSNASSLFDFFPSPLL
jgi:hypothetical protein